MPAVIAGAIISDTDLMRISRDNPGARYAIGIDPETREAYERGRRPDGLALNLDAIIDA